MTCIYCGATLREKALYCTECGRASQLVQDYNILEDEYLNDLMQEKSSPIPASLSIPLQERPPVKQIPKKTLEARERARKQKRHLILVSLFVLTALALALAVCARFVTKRFQSNSFEYQVNYGQQALSEENFASAQTHFERAIVLNPQTIDIRLRLADVYVSQNNAKQAISLYQEIIALDKTNYRAYQKLIELYAKQKEYQKIVALSKGVEDTHLFVLFQEYLVSPPKFSIEGGRYDRYLKVELTADANCKLYYSLEGLDPIANGTLYTKPFSLDEEGVYMISAVSVNGEGIYSDVVSKRYSISISAPSLPKVSPEGGNYGAQTRVTIDVPKDCIAYYTWDGSAPTVNSKEYTGEFLVPEGNHVLSVVIVDQKTQKVSDIFRSNYTYYEH